jgi:hypothetical protein
MAVEVGLGQSSIRTTAASDAPKRVDLDCQLRPSKARDYKGYSLTMSLAGPAGPESAGPFAFGRATSKPMIK